MYSCGGADLMGACAVGRQYGGVSRDHWFSMLDRPRKSVAQWHALTDHIPAPGCTVASTTTTTPVSGFDGNTSQPAIHKSPTD